ncbi:hypothetical protein F5884DRAFT_880153 [Xylogone sp. PMI_703]|nr:hypothetical protein F5884DRAFT_880153 [Xylogone sp. PMI_703]
MSTSGRYQNLKSSDDDGIEGELYFRPEPGRLRSLRDIPFNSENIVKWRGAIILCLYMVSAILVFASSRFPTDEQCTRKMSTWSPMMEAVEYEWTTWDMVNTDGYSGKPTEEIEARWDYLWQYGSLGIPASKLHLLNKSVSENWLYTAPELGGGVTALFEVFHQIHCLNLVRQYTYRDHYNYNDLPAFDQGPAMLLDHVEHCIEMLRIVLMCASDETPYLIESNRNGDEVVYPNSQRRCRNFQKLIDWAEEHVVEPYNATQELRKHADTHYEKNSSVIDTHAM